MGTYLEYDLFGLEKALYSANLEVHMPNDGERIRRIKVLCDNGYLNKVLISHDIHTKHRLVSMKQSVGYCNCHLLLYKGVKFN